MLFRSDRLRPDDIPVVILADDCDCVRFLIVRTEFSKDLIPANPDTDRNAQLKLDPITDFLCNQFSFSFTGCASGNIKPAFINPECFLRSV